MMIRTWKSQEWSWTTDRHGVKHHMEDRAPCQTVNAGHLEPVRSLTQPSEEPQGHALCEHPSASDSRSADAEDGQGRHFGDQKA